MTVLMATYVGFVDDRVTQSTYYASSIIEKNPQNSSHE